MNIPDNTQRFSSRAASYVKGRPSYPLELLAHLKSQCKLSTNSTIADIGAGTGIFTQQLLATGARVIAVEPNEPMRAAITPHDQLTIVAGSGEVTGLEDASVDLITCAQAFHWFANVRAVAEFRRILRPSGHVALIWNARVGGSDEFSEAYEALLKTREEYHKVNHRGISVDEIAKLFGAPVDHCEFENEQQLDWEGLYARAASSSYLPNPSDAAGPAFYAQLQAIFDGYARAGKVELRYRSELYLITLP